jgi:hypothetical protein
MTVGNTPFRKDHTLTGAIVPLVYDWRIDDKTHLLVTLVDTDSTPNVETTLVVDTDYTVTNVGVDGGGNVIPTDAYTADWKIVITPNVPFEQDTDFTNQNSVKPEVAEAMADKLSRQIKQIVETLNRTVKTTVGGGVQPDDLIDSINAAVASTDANVAAAAAAQSAAEGAETSAESWATAAQSAATGINWTKARVASTANVNIASPGAAIDGVNLVALDRVLLKNQTAPEENGLYDWNGAAVPMTRTFDMNTWEEVVSKVVQIEEGEGTNGDGSYINRDIPYMSTVNSGGTLGTTAITFTIFRPPLQDGSVTYAKCDAGVKASLDLADSALQSGDVTSAGRVLLATIITGASDPSVDIESVLSSTYDDYEIVFDNLVPLTDNVQLLLRTSSDNGVGYDNGASDYAYVYTYTLTSSGSTSSTGDGANNEIQVTSGISNDANIGITGKFTIHNVNSTTKPKTMMGDYWARNTSGVYWGGTFRGQRFNDGNAVNALQMIFGSGNIAAGGTVKVYGLRKT